MVRGIRRRYALQVLVVVAACLCLVLPARADGVGRQNIGLAVGTQRLLGTPSSDLEVLLQKEVLSVALEVYSRDRRHGAELGFVNLASDPDRFEYSELLHVGYRRVVRPLRGRVTPVGTLSVGLSWSQSGQGRNTGGDDARASFLDSYYMALNSRLYAGIAAGLEVEPIPHFVLRVDAGSRFYRIEGAYRPFRVASIGLLFIPSVADAR